MTERKTSQRWQCLALAVALAVVAATGVQATAATHLSGQAAPGLRTEAQPASATAPAERLAPHQLPPKRSTQDSYFWEEAGIVAGVLAGVVVLGLWGDVAIGAMILGIELLAARASRTFRKAHSYARDARRNPAPDRPTDSRVDSPSRSRGTKENLTIVTLVATVVAAGATGALAAGAGVGSSPDFVARGCGLPANAAACSISLHYLAALDLDRAGEACALLAAPTLAAAGGIPGCTKTLLQARGTRIRYAILAVFPSPLGRTIRFTTAGKGDPPLRQQMLVSSAGHIVAIVPEL